MPKRLLPVNIFLTCLIIALTAKIAADLVSYRLGRLVPAVGLKTSTTPPPSPASEDLASFAPILEKGLFGKATQGPLTPIAQATTQKQAAPTLSQGELTLLGTVQGSYRETFALVQKTSSKEERVFRLGDTVFNIGPLVAVHKESAEILSGNQRVKLYTPQATPATAAAPGAAAQASTQPGSLAAQVGAGSYVIDQRALNASLDNIGQAMTDARLLPSVKEGKVEGFRVSEVKPQGIFGTVGIKNGDVLLRINDFPIDSPEKAIQSFATLKGQSRIKLDLIRDGQPTTFTYDIR
jgi:general secretion pathway protein C